MQEKEFVDIMLPIRDKMYRFAKRMLISHDEAEDAVQEVFMRLWNQAGKFKKKTNYEAFTMTTVKNYCLDRLKSKQASQLSLVHSNYSAPINMEKQLEYQDSAGMVFEIMRQLPEQQQMAVQLRDVEGYNYQEMAEIMEMNETAVRVALSRARKAIREMLIKKQKYGINPG